MLRSSIVTLGMCLTILGGCAGYSSTQRLVDGELLEGPSIAPQAYALYLDGVLKEEAGQLAAAREAYLAAAEFEGDSSDLWARIGRLSCILALPSADGELDRAVREDPWYSPAWVEKSRCEVHRGNLDGALALAQRAQVTAPDDIATTRVLADVRGLRQQGEAALRLWIGYVSLQPSARTAWREILHWSREVGDQLWENLALKELGVAPVTSASPSREWSEGRPTEAPRALLDAVLSDDLKNARAYVTDHLLSQILILQLALDLGRREMALRQARLLVPAYPASGDVRAFALLAALRAENKQLFDTWSTWTTPTTPLSDAGEKALSHVLREAYGAVPELGSGLR